MLRRILEIPVFMLMLLCKSSLLKEGSLLMIRVGEWSMDGSQIFSCDSTLGSCFLPVLRDHLTGSHDFMLEIYYFKDSSYSRDIYL
jgi:hypothetical protein